MVGLKLQKNWVQKYVNQVENLIDKFLPLRKSNCPKKEIGSHCKDPYPCNYIDKCSPPDTDIKNVSYKILPYYGKTIAVSYTHLTLPTNREV